MKALQENGIPSTTGKYSTSDRTTPKQKILNGTTRTEELEKLTLFIMPYISLGGDNEKPD